MNNSETIHERITQLVDTFGKGKNTVFASLIGSNEANVRGYRTSVMPKFDFLEKVARNLEINLKWLLTGEGTMIQKSHQLQLESTQPAEQSQIVQMFLSQLEKKDEEIKKLNQQIIELSSQIAKLDEQNNTKGLGAAKNASSKKPSSPNVDNAASANAQ